MHKLILNSYAKVNLYLEVLAKRKDGYHNIKTVFERINLSDKIILKSRPDKKIKINCNFPGVPKGRANLCYRSAKLLQEEFKPGQGAEITIEKRIPVSAGLGGGSSNAATVLLGLNKIWKLGLSRAKLAVLAKKIGSDVPFFLYECPFANGTSRGDRVQPVARLRGARLWHILVVPGIKVSTPLIYRQWDRLGSFELTRPRQSAKILTLAIRKKDFGLIGEALFNSLEQASVKLYPQISRIKEGLRQLAVKSILMSGSGPAVFGIVSSRKEAVSLGRQLKQKLGSCQVFVTQTT
ncbi:MAG: 4-(cytidine 5'-diphospho)-2-C-methyl-D-erythritol kinase [Candidatus Omnitrophica bacterium]|nr:4-(cytidine 5'-diphospho)-2-C-methyl-D-erythritol kinase [Candidatus Omnitrophota bacterium]